MHRLIIAALAAALLLPGCGTIRATGDAVGRLVTGQEAPEVKAKRLLVVAYDAHAAATRTVRALYAGGTIDRERAENAADGLATVLGALNNARLLVALGDLTQGMDELRRAETMLRAIMGGLPKREEA